MSFRLSILVLLSALISNADAETTVVKNPVDQKLYRYTELENGLKVLLISDSAADKSAAALDINIGSGSNPKNWEGLAHFLEHMLFLGTMKYPKAGEYQEFVKNHGGSNNAYTSFDHTNYYFTIATNHLEEALDRFSHFFIDPTFDQTYVDRERSVVHSEFQARKKNENRRLWSAQRQWLNPDHPAARFTVGSVETLRDRADGSARDKLIEFYNQYYSANIMTLVVLGKEPLDQLEQWVMQIFSPIPNRDISQEVFRQPYFNKSLMPAWLELIPEKDVNSVSFVFPIPSTLMEYRSKPLNYIGSLLGHEGDDSLYSLLKDKGWAESLSAGAGYTDQVHGVFSIGIGLTKTGLDHINEIGGLLFQSINLVRESGVAEWRFLEQAKLNNIGFRFAQERNPGQVVQSLASRLHDYPAQDILQGPYMMDRFRSNRIRELLDYLRPDNVNVSFRSQSLRAKQKTAFYDVTFELNKIEPNLVRRWQSVTQNRALKLPNPNPFIPDRLDLLAIEKPTPIPERIILDSNISIWYRQDNEFGTPRANFYFNIMSPLANRSAKHLILTEIYTRMVDHQLSNVSYPAYLTELNYSLYRHRRGISVRIGGFEDKQSKILKLVIDALANPVFDKNRFEVIKAEILRELHNVSKNSPSNQVVHEIYRLLMCPCWTEAEQIDYLETASILDLKAFVSDFYSTIKVNALAHGDISVDNVIARTQLLEPLFSGSEFIDNIFKARIRELDGTKSYLRTKTVDHSDSALSLYFQGNDDTIDQRAKMRLLKYLIESPFYNQLRTINRVGYLVHAGTIEINQYPGLLFSVQSPSHSPFEIERLYTKFLDEFTNQLNIMNMSQFDSIKSGLITNILRKDKNLSERSDRYWREIDRDVLKFDSKDKLADAVLKLSLDDMRIYYSRYIVDRKKELLVQSLSNAGGQSSNIISGKQYTITGDAATFRNASQ